jgi:transposase
LDVHKETIAVAIADPEQTPMPYGTIANDPGAVRKLMRQLAEGRVVRVAYEAGFTGFCLYRQLAELGIECQVVAPSLIPRKAGDRVKTDPRDAITLARLPAAQRRPDPRLGARSRGRGAARPRPGALRCQGGSAASQA